MGNHIAATRHGGFVALTNVNVHQVMMQASKMNLNGKLLLAMPDMNDPRFDHSVIYICDHSDEGAMGLIINKPKPKLQCVELLRELQIDVDGIVCDKLVHYGGPVERARGFVLHSPEYSTEDGTIKVEGGLSMTVTVDVLKDIARGEGPVRSILALGCAGWGPAQLEGEIMQNSWLTCDATENLVFCANNDAKWEMALASLGVSSQLLTSTAGRA